VPSTVKNLSQTEFVTADAVNVSGAFFGPTRPQAGWKRWFSATFFCLWRSGRLEALPYLSCGFAAHEKFFWRTNNSSVRVV